ncbi:MAG: patatin-like phospholipase family protein [Sphaerochaeta sp.]|jgi:NTE family protein|uniref:patatin-like phospholipase family protein n=1 Tax=Sphaerochaeta sp. TaxID=1972642 RepID=UPI003D0C36AB
MMRRALLVLLLLAVSSSLFASPDKVAVVLSGGGARGMAHIAVLEALEEAGIPIDLVIGTSMGALVGALYSAGYTPKEIKSLITETDLTGLFSEPVLDTSRVQDEVFTYTHDHAFSLGFGDKGVGDAPALIGDQRILELLGYLFSRYDDTIDFDSLPIPFRCVATDAVSGEALVCSAGSLVNAIRSSISIPIIFTPYPLKKGMLAVDGGVTDNLPVALARSMGADIVIASDVNAQQIQDYDQLESLSAMAMQTIILVTQEKARVQHPLADLVFQPSLYDLFALDFGRWETILERGRQAVASKQSELDALAARISESRELVVYNPDRIGPYFLRSTPTILQLVVRDISSQSLHKVPSSNQFTAFLGRRLDAQTAEELNLKLRDIRKANGLATLGYEMAPQGTLVINSRGFGERTKSISMGLKSDAGLSTSLPSSPAWYRADVYLDASIEALAQTELMLLVNATLGTETGMQVGLAYPFALTKQGRMDVRLSLFYANGGMSTLTATVNSDRSASLDKAFLGTFALDFTFNTESKAELEGSYHLVSLNDSRYPTTFLAYPQLSATFLYNSKRDRFSPDGARLDMLASIGYLNTWKYAFRIGWSQVFELSYKESLGYDAQISLLRQPWPLLSSYAEVGMLEGLPGYGPLFLKRDLAMFGLTWQHRLSEILGYPTFSKVVLRGAMFDSYDPYTALESNTSIPFDSLAWDMGLGIQVGLDTPLGEVIANLGTSVKGKVTFSIGIY